jgi:type I restriction enzyme M protein
MPRERAAGPAKVLEMAAANAGLSERGLDLLLRRAAREAFYNTSPLTFAECLEDADNVKGNLQGYIAAFSEQATEVLDKFSFQEQIARLDER